MMAYEVMEHDSPEEEAARVGKAIAASMRMMLGHLAGVTFESRYDRQDVESLRRKAELDERQAERIKELAWKYRRQLPRGVAPVLPPHDPIVRQMEAARG